MGVWYFLLLFIGLFLVGKGLIGSKRISFVCIGALVILFALFMFSPGSDEIIADLLNLN